MNRSPGATPATATEGILLIGGAPSTISYNVVSGNACGSPDLGCGPDFFTEFQVFGIGADGLAVEVSHNLVFDNQVGIYLADSGAPERNLLVGNDFGLALQDGEFTSRGDVVLGGGVGAAVIAFFADTTARFHVSDRLALQGGYRWLRLEAHDDDQEVNVRLVGWQFGIELSL